MRIKLLSFLIVGAINSLATQQVAAEQANNGLNNLHSPVWPTEQAPIAWGECIPVPIMPSPQPMLYPMNPTPPPGFLPTPPFSNGQAMMIPEPSMLMPPPSPFFNPAQLPIPLPMPHAIPTQVSCDNSDTLKLNKLQAHYNLASSKSKTKITELHQVLEDLQNQMTDSKDIIEKLEAKIGEEAQTKNANELEKTKFKVLQTSYKNQNIEINKLNKKLTEIEALKKELTAFQELQTKYQHQNITNYELKKKLTETETAKQSLQAKIAKLNESTKAQSEKLGILKQASTEFKVLQEAYQIRNNEIIELNSMLVEADTTKGSLQKRLNNLEKDTSVQAQKLTSLGETATEFKTLQKEHQQQTTEVSTLRQKLADTDTKLSILQEQYQKQSKEVAELEQLLAKTEGTKKSLQIKLGDFQESSNIQTQKLSALGQTATEFEVLQEAYQLQNNEVTGLQKKLSETDTKLNILREAYQKRSTEVAELEKLLATSDDTKKALLGKLSTLEESSSSQLKKLSALGKVETEFKVLQETFQIKNHEFSKLKTTIVEIDTKKTALQGKLDNLRKDRDEQKIELAELQQKSVEYTKLQKEYQLRNTENIELKKKLSEIEVNNKTLTAQLKGLESDTANQAEKLASLGKSTTELSILQKSYKARLKEITELKNKLATMDDEYKSLQAKLTSVETNSVNQARKLTALGQTSIEFATLQGVYKERNDENTNIKKKLAGMEVAYKELQSKLNNSESKASAQSEELIVLGKTAKDLGSLQIAYKGSVDNNATLKKQLTETDSAYKTLQAKLARLESNSSNQLRKLNSLAKSANELSVLKGVFKERNNENANLKKQLAEINNNNKSLQGKLTKLELSATNQAEKITALGKSSTELNELQKAYKAKLSEIEALKQRLAKMDNTYKTLQSKFTGIESDTANQAKKLIALEKSATTLKDSYNTRNNENIKLKKELADQRKSSDQNINSCKVEITKLEKRLTSSGVSGKSLLATIAMLKKTSSDQSNEITSLMATTSELDILKAKYKDLEGKLAAATADSDNDGVLDQKDKCPSSPAGTEVNILGCLADNDNDGVANSSDQCLTSPAGSAVNSIGCPVMKDTDNDGVADKGDLCPTTKTGETVNNFGCTPAENITLKGVNFATGSATLTSSSLPILDKAAKTLTSNPTITSVQVSGHTDDKGIAAINKRLSQRRANSVMIYLIKKGVNANRLSAKGYGESQPIATNDSEDGRATNRRVELKIR